MLRQSNRIARASRAFSRDWQQNLSRPSSTTAVGDPQWFQALRSELLGRKTHHIQEYIGAQHQYKFAKTFEGITPPELELAQPTHLKRTILPIGQHLIWFNLAVPSDKLLPDGTDDWHSPGSPWVRRMWSGGSLQVRTGTYFDLNHGFDTNREYLAIERVKDVQLRGENDAAKIFVTIERRFARMKDLNERARTSPTPSMEGEKMSGKSAYGHFKSEMKDGVEWGTALLKEERTLVFLKARTLEELEAFKAGELTTPRYLTRPGEPDFSYTFTPTRMMLFRYSALTFNAHLIHLDKEYAQKVEGHRNLLVHGPLTLTLMLKAIAKCTDDSPDVFQSIDYRNLAPLYCDEELRICVRKRKESQSSEKSGSVFDVWIEGPTGGVAVKGTVYSTRNPPGSGRAKDFRAQLIYGGQNKTGPIIRKTFSQIKSDQKS